MQFAATFLDVVIDSMIIEQARRDPVRGQQDLQCFSLMFFGIGSFVGSIVGAYVTQNGIPLWGFGFNAFICLIISYFGFCTDESLETN